MTCESLPPAAVSAAAVSFLAPSSCAAPSAVEKRSSNCDVSCSVWQLVVFAHGFGLPIQVCGSVPKIRECVCMCVRSLLCAALCTYAREYVQADTRLRVHAESRRETAK